MQDDSTNSPFINIEFPRKTGLIKKLRSVSFIINDLVILFYLLVILIWMTNIPVLKVFLFQQLSIYPISAIFFILSGICLLFGAKRHLISTYKDAEKEDNYWWHTWIPIILATITAGFGLINFIQLTNTGLLSLFHISSVSGFCFFLIGLALIPPYTRIPHRFHISQLLIFIVSGLSLFTFLETLYQLFSPYQLQQIMYMPLPVGLSFALLCFGILIRWSNRGFFGNFTLDSTVSKFAFRLILINIILAPMIAFIVLFVMQNKSYNMYQVLTVVVVLVTFISSAILWINVKLLYSYDLEHLLMRESLRAHNIDLAAEKEQLRKSIDLLEQEKHQYIDKLNTRNSLQDIMDAQR